MRFLPTDEQFYVLLEELASRLSKAAGLLDELFANPGRAPTLIATIKDVEHDADKIAYTVVERIDKSFITPIDREDIHLLATKLDNVIDLIDGTARRLTLFQITEVQPDARRLAAFINEAAQHLETGVGALRTSKPGAALGEHLAAIKRLEEQGDAQYQSAVEALFVDGADPIHVIKWKEMYDRLEDALDECQHAAQVVQSVGLKHA